MNQARNLKMEQVYTNDDKTAQDRHLELDISSQFLRAYTNGFPNPIKQTNISSLMLK